MKHSTPILSAVASMHAEQDKHPCDPAGLCLPNGSPGSDPYNTVRPLDVVAWEAPEAPISESVTMWTDENGLDCYTNEQLPALEDKS